MKSTHVLDHDGHCKQGLEWDLIGPIQTNGDFCMRAFLKHTLILTALLAMLAPQMSYAAHVLLFGGTRGVGLEIARILVNRGDSVTAFVRPTSDRSGLEPLGVSFAVGDALDAASVRAVFAGQSLDSVVTSLGAARGESNAVDDVGTKNVVEAAKTAGVPRFVMVSAVGVGSSKNAVPERVYKILEPGLISKKVGEDYLAGSGLKFTIVRPGGLDNGPATNTFDLIEDPTGPFERVDRAEVARLTVKALDDEGTVGKRYHVGIP